jgi:hypothetical protein
MATKEVLDALAGTLSVVRQGPGQVAFGQKITCGLAPDPKSLTVTDLVSGPIDVALLTKNVTFNDPGFETIDLDNLGGLLGEIKAAPLSGISGTIQQIKGTIPVKLEVPVKVEAKWEVLDEAKNPIGGGFIAPEGLETLSPSFIFTPNLATDVVELTTTPAPPVGTRYLRASVRLSAPAMSANATATTVEGNWVPLPEVPVVVVKIAVPTLLAMFVDTDFAPSAALVVVPAASPLKTLEQAQQVLDTLTETIDNLRNVMDLGAWLLGLSELTGAIGAQPHIQFRATDRINNFNDITLIQNAWYENDIEAEDELSSLIMTGPPGRRVELFNDRDCETDDEDWFELTLGPSMFALVRNLHSDNPAVVGDAQLVPHLDNGDDSFGDQLSSLKF